MAQMVQSEREKGRRKSVEQKTQLRFGWVFWQVSNYLSGLVNESYVGRRRTFLTRGDFELNLVTLPEGLEP